MLPSNGPFLPRFINFWQISYRICIWNTMHREFLLVEGRNTTKIGFLDVWCLVMNACCAVERVFYNNSQRACLRFLNRVLAYRSRIVRRCLLKTPIVHEDTDCFPCGWPPKKPAPRQIHRDRMPQELVDTDQERFCADSHQSASLFTKELTFECFRPIPDAPAQTIEPPLREPVTLPRSKSRTVPLFVQTAQVTRLQTCCRFRDISVKQAG